MKKIEKFYDNTQNLEAHDNVKKIVELNIKPEKATELGCGAGRDTIYLIKNGWDILAIDREDVEYRIKEKLSKEEQKHFKFSKQRFEDLKLEKNKLIIANYSLSFCNKNKFKDLWNEIVNSIEENGYFVGNFFGPNDEWKEIKKEMTFLSKKKIIKLFKEFEIISIKEIEEERKTGLGKIKYWHIIDVIAKKTKNTQNITNDTQSSIKK